MPINVTVINLIRAIGVSVLMETDVGGVQSPVSGSGSGVSEGQ